MVDAETMPLLLTEGLTHPHTGAAALVDRPHKLPRLLSLGCHEKYIKTLSLENETFLESTVLMCSKASDLPCPVGFLLLMASNNELCQYSGFLSHQNVFILAVFDVNYQIF